MSFDKTIRKCNFPLHVIISLPALGVCCQDLFSGENISLWIRYHIIGPDFVRGDVGSNLYQKLPLLQVCTISILMNFTLCWSPRSEQIRSCSILELCFTAASGLNLSCPCFLLFLAVHSDNAPQINSSASLHEHTFPIRKRAAHVYGCILCSFFPVISFKVARTV